MSDKTDKLYGLQDILIDEFIERIQSGAATPSDPVSYTHLTLPTNREV